jgi:acyl-CoA synthetase (AMP-forming)/AMP-acid ligase II
MSVIGGTHVCLRWVRAKAIWQALAEHRVTHLCGAPIVMSTILGAPAEDKRPLSHAVEFFTAAAPPPEAVLAAMAEAGFNVTHLYGLTETYGPAVVNDWKEDWSSLASPERAALKARQGVRYCALEDLAVLEPETMKRVPADGATMGEVMFRGNVVMKGYLKNRAATEAAFRGGWFHSGDLGVLHPDGYIQLKDRSKDIIISGGENISSIEVGMRFTSTRRSRRRRWWPSPTRNGARVPVPSSSSRRVPRRAPRNSSNGAASGWRDSRCHATWCSRSCRKPRRARSRSFACARWRKAFEGDGRGLG